LKAVVKYALGPGNVELREVDEPAPQPDEVKIEVKAATFEASCCDGA